MGNLNLLWPRILSDLSSTNSFLGRVFLVLRDARFDELLHERGGEGLVDWKVDTALGDVVALELDGVGAHHVGAHNEKAAVVLERSEANKELPMVFVCRYSVADDLSSIRYCYPNYPPKLLKRGSLILQ